mmetsp:Transcript_9236/g.37844  ORF Transcript_9236/g.37844 Transcript_9236/m.37844 type:complete len:1005 (-) Transcript_9236:1999-5013(-)
MFAATQPHIDSFDAFIQCTASSAVRSMLQQEVSLNIDQRPVRLAFRVTAIDIGRPVRAGPRCFKLLPRECRESSLTYSAPMRATFEYQFGDHAMGSLTRQLGNCPIMVMSSRCHLAVLRQDQLISAREERAELGGYFIIRGVEKVVRLLQVPKRNIPLAVRRNSFKKRGPLFTAYAVVMRCARCDLSTCTMTLHYLKTGALRLRVTVNKQEVLIPLVLILKALQPHLSDTSVHTDLTMSIYDSYCARSHFQSSVADIAPSTSPSKGTIIAQLGAAVKKVMRVHYANVNDCEHIGQDFLQRYIAVHVSDHPSKYAVLAVMANKLIHFTTGHCAEDNVDSLGQQELLLPGDLLTGLIKEYLQDGVASALHHMWLETQVDATRILQMHLPAYLAKTLHRYVGSIGTKVEAFLATGNLISRSGLDIQQSAGFSIVAERLNMWRYISHFRSVHRGQFFTTMKTTTVRKLLPESWGFLCPVHTPDGAPCGLLSHLAAHVHVCCSPQFHLQFPDWLEEVVSTFISLGMSPVQHIVSCTTASKRCDHACFRRMRFPIVLDGAVLGFGDDSVCRLIARVLGYLKSNPATATESTIEIAYVSPSKRASTAFALLHVFSSAGRLVRPVFRSQGLSRLIEYIGPLEQTTLRIHCTPNCSQMNTSLSSHVELSPYYMLSVIASLTPFSDMNQSPRNVYQCQMAKQTMGTPAYSLAYRNDHKLYRVFAPQTPIVQTCHYCGLTGYPQGFNSVVAVISYTGYDMEDAMILNKSSFQRGFGHGVMYKTRIIDLDAEKRVTDVRGNPSALTPRFSCGAHAKTRVIQLEFGNKLSFPSSAGLPEVGQRICRGDPLWYAVDEFQREIVGHYVDAEAAVVDSVRLLGPESSTNNACKAVVNFRYPRNPVVGDKFSSRHGQKGVLSMLWPDHDMPFTESGLSPDVIINPHAFPSRMTIGMLVESLAGKCGALHGLRHDGTPFTFCSGSGPVVYFGEQLRTAGYSYFGSERVQGVCVHCTDFHATA